jgi:hypothetical protein
VIGIFWQVSRLKSTIKNTVPKSSPLDYGKMLTWSFSLDRKIRNREFTGHSRAMLLRGPFKIAAAELALSPKAAGK